MMERITEIVNDIKEKHGFKYTDEDLLAIAMGVDILKSFGRDDPDRITKTVTDAAILIGLRNQYPDIPVHYAFLFTN